MNKSALPIATPCGQDFDTMTPKGTSRFCGDCKKLVHDLASLKKKDAQKLLSTPTTEGLCIRYLYDEHGNVWFKDTMLLLAEGLLKKVAAAALIAAAPTLTACLGSYDGPALLGIDSDAAAPADDGGAAQPPSTIATPSVGDSDAGADGSADGLANSDAAADTDADGGADASATDAGM